jgi:hypothetical protein
LTLRTERRYIFRQLEPFRDDKDKLTTTEKFLGFDKEVHYD